MILGDQKVYLAYEDDATSELIDIPGGMSTGDKIHTSAFVRHSIYYKFRILRPRLCR